MDDAKTAEKPSMLLLATKQSMRELAHQCEGEALRLERTLDLEKLVAGKMREAGKIITQSMVASNMEHAKSARELLAFVEDLLEKEVVAP